jgi:hypothetical protein
MTLSTHILKFHQDIYPPTGIATEYGKRLPGGDYESRKSRKDKNPGIQDGSSMAINDVTTRNYNDIDPSLLYNAQPYLSPYNASTITPGGNNQGGLVPASICYSTQAVPTPQGNVVIQNELNSSMVDNQEWRIRSWNLAQNAAVEAQLSQVCLF